MIDEKDIQRLATRLGSVTNAFCVILFGSFARGNPNESSDVDWMIIAESDQPRFKRSRSLYKLFRPYPFGMDLLVYTPQEIERGKRVSVSFVSKVLREGKTLYVGRDGHCEAVAGQSQEYIHGLHIFWTARGHKLEKRTFSVLTPHESFL